jgi:hypothetical protein
MIRKYKSPTKTAINATGTRFAKCEPARGKVTITESPSSHLEGNA